MKHLEKGYPRHLDNTSSTEERKDILQWFKKTPDAILTSVGILTTGFDEPTVDTIILNRATKFDPILPNDWSWF
jgi:superfamily II DNA or RNA helicase